VLLMSQAREVDICEMGIGCNGISSVALGDEGKVSSEASFLRSGEGFAGDNRWSISESDRDAKRYQMEIIP